MGPERHPSALGQKGKECWTEIWDIIGPQIEHVMAGSGATWHEEQLVPVTRHGRLEQVYWTYGFSPIDNHEGVGGVLVVCRDITREHFGKLALQERETELARVQAIGRIGGLEVDLRTGHRNRKSPEYLTIHGLPLEAVHESLVRTGFAAFIPTIARSPKGSSSMRCGAVIASTRYATVSSGRATARHAGFPPDR